jgi:hypothetical protein
MIELRAARAGFAGQVEVLIADVRDGKIVAAPSGELPMQPVQEGGYVPPSFSLPRNVAQRLMDDLWDCGLRPSEGSGSAGAMLATQNHLKDMQAINKGLLKKIGVNLG